MAPDDVLTREIIAICQVIDEDVRQPLLREIEGLKTRVRHLEDHMEPLKTWSHTHLPSRDQAIAKIVREAEGGNWEPWRWADDLGVDEATIVILLSRYRRIREYHAE